MFSRYFRFKSDENGKKKKDKDISLVVKDGSAVHSAKVSRNLLLESSAFFRDFSPSELKKCRKIKMEGVTVVAVKNIVEYIQQKAVSFRSCTDALETLTATHKYGFEAMQTVCTNHLITTLDPGNVCQIYETACELSLGHLEFHCLKLIDRQAEDVLKSRGFLTLKKSTAIDVVKRGSLDVSSESSIFQAVMGWGFNECHRNGTDASNDEIFMRTVGSFLRKVRFTAMTEDELKDSDVQKFHRFMHSEEPIGRRRSVSFNSQSSAGSSDPRQYRNRYVHKLNPREAFHQTVKCGETFGLRVDVMKGRLFITKLSLALRAFAPTKQAACLYVELSVSNVTTAEHKTTRGTFLNTAEEASLELGCPLSVRESETVEVSLTVRRAENICHFGVGGDVQIAMPDSKVVAMKITPMSSSVDEETVPCIIRELEYFF